MCIICPPTLSDPGPRTEGFTVQTDPSMAVPHVFHGLLRSFLASRDSASQNFPFQKLGSFLFRLSCPCLEHLSQNYNHSYLKLIAIILVLKCNPFCSFGKFLGFFSQNKSKSSIFLVPTPTMGFSFCSFPENHMESWSIGLYEECWRPRLIWASALSTVGPKGELCEDLTVLLRPPAQSPEAIAVTKLIRYGDLVSHLDGISNRQGWLWSFDIFPRRICTVLSQEPILSSLNPMAWMLRIDSMLVFPRTEYRL